MTLERDGPPQTILAARGGQLCRCISFLLIALLVAACRQEQPPLASSLSTDAVKIHVTKDGFYSVSQAELEQAGFRLDSFESSNLHLGQAGQDVPYLLSGSNLIFYGQAPTNRYAATRPYILRTGSAGLLMAERIVSAAGDEPITQVRKTLHLEENLNYVADAGDSVDGDKWLWQTLGQAQQLSLTMSLVNVTDAPATMRMRFWGTTHNPQIDNDHDFDLLVNEHSLGSIRWEGRTHFTAQTEFPAGILREGDNDLLLDNEVAGASFLDIMELDWIELDYWVLPGAVDDRLLFGGSDGSVNITGFMDRPFIFDVSAAEAPKLLTGWAYRDSEAHLAIDGDMQIEAIGSTGFLRPDELVPLTQSGWRSPAIQADLIVITTAELAPAMERLVEAREAQGIGTVLVPLGEVYDEFGYGFETPDSINAFISYAFENWMAPRPRYLLIVGDATIDYRDYLGKAPRNNVPSPMVPVMYGGETVSDARLVDVDDDSRSELAVGRWPVDSIDQVEKLVDRTLAYEQSAASGDVLFAADGTEARFAAAAERIAENANLDRNRTDILVGANAQEIAARWNSGTWLTVYIGHGSVERWGKDDVFYPEAVEELRPSHSPIVLQLTCLSGLFAHPDLTSLSETMLLHEQGPVLLIAATSLTLSTHQEVLALPLLESLQDPEIVRVGDAFQRAKETLDISNPGLREISDTYVLLGDPSALIVRPEP
jgi:hypothetical protein